MRTKIKVKFIGFDPYFPPRQQPFYRMIARHFDIEESDKPDFIFDRGRPFDHWQYSNCVKILFMCENSVPDFNVYDYAIGFDHMSFGDRYLRNPLFSRYGDDYATLKKRTLMSNEDLLNRRFCSFIVSNSSFADPMRERFFKELSKYKRVDSGGKHLNNIGGPVKDKLTFCRNYKFNIAFENSVALGYTTEKIMQAYAAQSLPIYYGNPAIDTDFRLESMVRVTGISDIKRAIDEIVFLDENDDAYLARVTAPCLTVDDPEIYEKQLEEFLIHILNQSPAEARRLNAYGNQPMMQGLNRRLFLAYKRYNDFRNTFKRMFTLSP